MSGNIVILRHVFTGRTLGKFSFGHCFSSFYGFSTGFKKFILCSYKLLEMNNVIICFLILFKPVPFQLVLPMSSMKLLGITRRKHAFDSPNSHTDHMEFLISSSLQGRGKKGNICLFCTRRTLHLLINGRILIVWGDLLK